MKKTHRRQEIANYWSEKEPQFVEDVDHPSCFACGYDGDGSWKHWGTERLEEAHIIADSIGGDRNPENILLLCGRCHRDAPMAGMPWAMIDWARGRDSYVDFVLGGMAGALRASGVTAKQISRHGGSLYPRVLLAMFKALRLDSHPRSHGPNFTNFATAIKVWFDLQDGIGAPLVVGGGWETGGAGSASQEAATPSAVSAY